jgi:hypothetical protein
MTLLLATSPSQKVLGWFGGNGLKGTVGYPTANGFSLPIAYGPTSSPRIPRRRPCACG